MWAQSVQEKPDNLLIMQRGKQGHVDNNTR